MINFLYIDPAMVSGIAAFAGTAVIAAGAAFAIWYRRAKKKVAQVLNIDENANKEKEEELVIYDEDSTETSEK